MKWLHFIDVPFNYTKKGKLRESDVWIDCDEMINDSGRSKGMRMMDMTISMVPGMTGDMLFLHFNGQEPKKGIYVGWIDDDNE